MASQSGAIRAGKAFVELFADDSKLVRGLKSAEKKMQAWASSITAIGAKVFAGGAGFAAGLAATTTVFANLAGDLDDMSQRTGVAASSLSELSYAAKMSGTDIETVEGSITKMQKALVEAGEGAEGPTEALKKLGLTADQLKGLSPEEQFLAIGDALSRVEDPAQKVAIAMDIFGKSGKAMLNVFNDGAAGVEAFRQKARDLGITLSDDAALAGAAFGDQLDNVWLQVKAVAVQLGAALVPALSDFVSLLSSGLSRVIAWVKENGQLIRWIMYGTVAVAGLGAALVVLGGILSTVATVLGGVAAIFGTIASAIGFLLTPIGAVLAGLAGLAGYFVFAGDQGAATLKWLSDAFGQLATDATDAFGAIGDALAMGDIQQAAKVLWSFLKLQWTQGINWISGKWDEFSGFVVDVWKNAQQIIAEVALKVWAGLQIAWVKIKDFFADLWDNAVENADRANDAIQDTMAKHHVFAVGLMDKELAAQEEARLKNQAAEYRTKRDAEREAAKKAGNESRDKEINDIIKGTQGALDVLANDHKKATDARAAARAKAVEDAKKEAAAARADFDATVKETKDKKKEFDARPKTDPARIKQQAITIPDIKEKAEAAKTAGTFSAAAAARLGNGQSQIAVLKQQLEEQKRANELLAASKKIWGNVKNWFSFE